MRTRARRPGRGQDERRLRQIELQRERLHGRVVEAAPVLEHGERIAGERRLGEDVDDAKGVAVIVQLATASSASTRARSSRASARSASREVALHASMITGVRAGREIALERARVGRIVVRIEQLRDQRIPVARRPPSRSSARLSPCRAARCSGSRRCAEQRRVAREKCAYSSLSSATRCAGGVTSVSARPARMRASSASGICTLPIRRLSDSTNTGRARIEPRQRVEELALEPLLRRLRVAGQIAEERPAMPRDAFEIEGLRADVARARQAAGSCPSRSARR